MSTVNNVNGNVPIQPVVNSPVQRSTPPDAAGTPRAADQLELSGVSSIFQTLQANNIRADKVASVKSQIDAGTYEDDNKLNVAADRLLDELSK